VAAFGGQAGVKRAENFQALGFAIVVCSWWLHIKSADYRPLMGNQWLTAPVVLIISGLDLNSSELLNV
jgi:hypothetical protein